MPAATIDADVIVIGGGGTGLAAAATAARLGRKVILIEKNAALGGSTAWSVGSISVNRSPHQKRAGITDSPDEHFEDLILLAGTRANRDNPALRRILVDNISETFGWLLSTGLVFTGPALEPPHRYPRMHNVLPNSRAFPHYLGRHCRALGVDIRTSVAAEQIVREGDRASSVIARGPSGQTLQFRARHGIVLATGDYSGDRELKAQLASETAAKTSAVNATNTGDGHRLALALGASIVNGDIVHGPRLRFVPPAKPSLIRRLPPNALVAHAAKFAAEKLPSALLRPFLMSFVTTALGVEANLYKHGAILVNARGERFTDELGAPQDALPDQPDQIAYVILDGAIAQTFSRWPNFLSTAPGVAYAYIGDYRRNRRDIFREAPTPEALAARINVPPLQLARTLAASGKLRQPPYIALGPIKPYVVLTDGGLRVTEQLEVIGAGGAPIAGLYAAGATGQGGLLLYGHGHHLGWAFVSGRIAGRNAALNGANTQALGTALV